MARTKALVAGRKTPGPRFIPQLESLRGVAALCVLLGHCYRMTGRIGGLPDTFPMLASILNVAFDPQPPVVLFFVLSGLVLGIQLRSAPAETPTTYLAFILRRLFRLVPALWLSVLFASTIVALGIPMPNAGFGSVKVLSVDAVAGALLLYNPALNAATWSLSVEMVGSLAFPIMFWIYSRGRLLAHLSLTLVLLLIAYYPAAPLPAHFLICFFVGLIASGLTPKIPAGRMTFSATLIVALTIFVASPELATFGAPSGSVSHIRDWMWLCTMASLVIVVFCAQIDRGQMLRVLLSAPLRFVGRISYSLYLLHLPVLLTLLYLCRNYAPDLVRSQVGIALVVSTVVLLSIAAASLSYFAIERRFIRWGHTVADYLRRLDPRDGAAGNPAAGPSAPRPLI